MTKNKIKIKILKALRNGFLTFEDLESVLIFKSKSQLQIFVDAINELYNEDLVMPVSVIEDRGLILCQK